MYETDDTENSQQSGCVANLLFCAVLLLTLLIVAYVAFPFSTKETLVDKRWKASVIQYEYRYVVVGHTQLGKYRMPRYDYRWVVVLDTHIVGPQGRTPVYPEVACPYVVHDPYAVGDTYCEKHPVEYQVAFMPSTYTYYVGVPYEEWALYEKGDEVKVTWYLGDVKAISGIP